MSSLSGLQFIASINPRAINRRAINLQVPSGHKISGQHKLDGTLPKMIFNHPPAAVGSDPEQKLRQKYFFISNELTGQVSFSNFRKIASAARFDAPPFPNLSATSRNFPRIFLFSRGSKSRKSSAARVSPVKSS